MKLPTFNLAVLRAGDVALSGHYGEANLSGDLRRATYEGREILVVPVVMLRQTVVHGANADAPALVPLDELMAESWNGVPVTVGHPNDQGAFASANSPAILSKWKIGRIFNAKLDGDKLKAEAWVDIVRANKVKPGLIAALESGKPMDVSTGYFSRHDATPGEFNGRAYSVQHRDIKPDHLALLPDENGACSWQDGCGVRANTGNPAMSKIKAAINALAAALGCGCDPETVISNLIADTRAPFGEADRAALQAMSAPALTALREKFIPAANEEENSMTDKPKGKVTVNAADLVKTLGVDQATADKMAAAANAEAPMMTPEEIAAKKKKEMMDKIADNSKISVAVLATLPDSALEVMAAAADKANESKASTLSAADQEALTFARTARDDHRAGLVAKIIGNSDMKAEAIKDMSLATLETIAAGLKPAASAANFSGRHVPAANFANEDKEAEGMVPISFAAALAAKDGKKNKEAA
jgi:hypothetical protein